MSFLEEQYLRRVSYKLRNYKENGRHRFNFSCPICNDSSKKKNKARGFAFDKSGRLNVYCHNCGYSKSFPNFLKDIDQLMYQEFVMERFKEKMAGEINADPMESGESFMAKILETRKYIPDIFSPLPRLNELRPSHQARMYADSRKLPLNDFEFYFVEHFIEWTKGHTDKFESVEGDTHPRVVIPFYARDGHILGYTARALNGEEPKYYRIFVDNDEKEKFFGIDRLDETKQVYVLEGEIDSMFLPNALAVSNGKLHTYMNKNAIYIPDADKRNLHIVRNIKEMLDLGLKVCLLPDTLPGKDINDLVVAGFDTEKIVAIINANVYQGMTGLLKFNQWKMCDENTYQRKRKSTS